MRAWLRNCQVTGPGTGREGPRTAIRCRWHDAGVAEVPPATPGKQAVTGLAPYGLRLQAEGISSGPVEARTPGTATAARPGSAANVAASAGRSCTFLGEP